VEKSSATPEFADALAMYERAEYELNEAKRRFLGHTERQSFSSTAFILFENQIEAHYMQVHEVFYSNDYSHEIAAALGSSDPEFRLSALKLVKSAVPGWQLTDSISSSIVLLSIDGNDEERLLSKKVLKNRYLDSLSIIKKAEEISDELLDAAKHNPDQYYYLYQYTGEVFLVLRAADALRNHVNRGEEDSNPEICELASDLREKMIRTGT
jgi:hypothetical protein